MPALHVPPDALPHPDARAPPLLAPSPSPVLFLSPAARVLGVGEVPALVASVARRTSTLPQTRPRARPRSHTHTDRKRRGHIQRSRFGNRQQRCRGSPSRVSHCPLSPPARHTGSSAPTRSLRLVFLPPAFISCPSGRTKKTALDRAAQKGHMIREVRARCLSLTSPRDQEIPQEGNLAPTISFPCPPPPSFVLPLWPPFTLPHHQSSPILPSPSPTVNPRFSIGQLC